MKLSLSQNLTSKVSAAFDPAAHSNIKAFYKFKSLGTSDIAAVSIWNDQTGNFNYLQSTDSEKPSYTASTGAVAFDGDDHISSSSEISLSGAFIVAIRLSVDSSISNDIMIASDTSANNFIRFDSASSVRFKIAGSASKFITLDSNIVAGQKHTVMLARNDSNENTFFLDGVAQADTEVLSGTLLIDTLGQRAGNANHFAGKIFEVQVYNTMTTDLITKVNNRLSSL